MEDMFYAIIGLAFIITLAVLAQKRRNKHFTKKCPKCGYPTVHPKPTGLKYTGGCPCYMGHRTKRILRIERKEYQTY